MSEGVQASPELSNRNKRIRNPRDFYGGLSLAALGVLALWASRDLPGLHGFAFGPGTAPRMFAVLLILLSLAVAATGYLSDGPAMERFAIRGPVFLTLAVLLFAAFIRPLGLVITTYLTIVVSAAATTESRWLETLIWGAVLTAFCVLLFPMALNLPLQLWPAHNLSWASLISFR